MSEQEFEYGDYDLEEDVTPVPISEALPYHDSDEQDDLEEGQARSFVSVLGVSPREAIAEARRWVLNRISTGRSGLCLRTIRTFYGVPSKYLTASQSWEAADHKHFASSGADVPRGAPVWWTGGSKGAGHVAISVGGGMCISTDWKELARVNYARIDDITNFWGLDFKGWTREVNDVVVWRPSPPKATVRLSNLKPGKRNDDVLRMKRRLHEKGYKGFLLHSGKFGKGTQKAYATYQRRLGYSGTDANGIPGVTSLKKLGFKVI